MKLERGSFLAFRDISDLFEYATATVATRHPEMMKTRTFDESRPTFTSTTLFTVSLGKQIKQSAKTESLIRATTEK